MKTVWLIEAGIYGEEADPLLAEIRRQEIKAEVIPHKALQKGQGVTVGGQPLPEDACVIGYGTFPFARQIQLHHRWVPGAWATPENLDCTTYFGHFGRFLLNQHYAILPGLEAIRQQEWLFQVFGRDDAVFVRPTGCHKLFTGRLISKDSFTAGLAPTRYDPATLVVIAAPRDIHREWRLVLKQARFPVPTLGFQLPGSRRTLSALPCQGSWVALPYVSRHDTHFFLRGRSWSQHGSAHPDADFN